MTRNPSIRLDVSVEAAQAIIDQASYYREHSSDSALDARWEHSVKKTIHSLLTMPERGTPCTFRSPKLAEVRWIPVTGFPSHKVFYLFRSKTRTVLVVDVLHGARDLDALFSARE